MTNEPILDINQIQANIAPGFRLPFQHLIFVRTEDKGCALRLIKTILPRITRMSEAISFHSKRLESIADNYTFSSNSFELVKEKPVWLNIGLGEQLLEKLGVTQPADSDRSFKLGLDRRSFSLGDPRNPTHEGHRSNWVVGGPQNRADIILIVASSEEQLLDNVVGALIEQIEKLSNEIIFQERGRRLDDDKEHFGFRDGISQPGMRGLVASEPEKFLVKRQMKNLPNGPEYAAPGRPLVWTGEFIFGYPQQSPNHFRNPAPYQAVDPLLKNGSFLVFRRLKQDVKRFRDETARMAVELATHPDFANVDMAWLQAKLVGRWPNGNALVRQPNAPSQSPEDENAINYFNFGDGVPEVTLLDSTDVLGATSDPNGFKCPFHAHIRKVNPRDRATDLGAETNNFKLRILRRGIPYGPPFDEEPEEENRGLLFLCYQTSIRDQFEQLTIRWVNSTANPEPGFDEGFDMILGQNGSAENRERSCVFKNALGSQATVSTLADFVIPTGGGYFFCPSITLLQHIIQDLKP